MASAPSIQTTAGWVQGTTTGDFELWRGVPYAAAPVGPRRFRAPVAAESWEGVRPATAYGPAPWPTPFSRTSRVPAEGKFSEDCLTVNITRRAGEGTGRPVIVYIYGGGNRTGASSIYPGERLVSDSDLIAVTFNFRIGVLGFLDLAGLPGGEEFDSNLALRDQLAALRWVQDNIAAFGGDPGNVTIYGESAGALAVTTLLATPAAAGLFTGSVSASSPAFHVYSRERTRDWAARYLRLLGLEKPDTLAHIQQLPARSLIAAAMTFDRQTRQETTGTISVSYAVDDDLLPEAPISAFRAGRAHRVPLLIGTCRDEHVLFAKILKGELAGTRDELERLFAASGADVLDRVLTAYTVEGQPAHTRIGGDAAFWYPSVAIAEAHSRYAPTRMFRVDHSPRISKLLGLGPTHGSDVALLFGAFDGVEKLLGSARSNDAFVGNLRADLTAFARDGDPGAGWPRYESTTRATRIYTTGTTVVEDPEQNRRSAWEGFIGYP
jgi:para-nitrobenzyl esterase